MYIEKVCQGCVRADGAVHGYYYEVIGCMETLPEIAVHITNPGQDISATHTAGQDDTSNDKSVVESLDEPFSCLLFRSNVFIHV